MLWPKCWVSETYFCCLQDKNIFWIFFWTILVNFRAKIRFWNYSLVTYFHIQFLWMDFLWNKKCVDANGTKKSVGAIGTKGVSIPPPPTTQFSLPPRLGQTKMQSNLSWKRLQIQLFLFFSKITTLLNNKYKILFLKYLDLIGSENLYQ